MSKYYHPFRIVNPSPWPILMSFSLGSFLIGVASVLHNYKLGNFITSIGLFMVIIILIAWFKDIISESCYLGYRTSFVQIGIKLSFYLFVISEIFVFFSVFWAFFYASLSPNIEIGCVFPSIGIIAFDPWSVPLLNTLILLSSGVSLTWARRAMVSGDRKDTIHGLLITIFLGCIFSFFQFIEYTEATFTINDSIYGSTFFACTGLRGIRVIVGTLFLISSIVRLFNYEFTKHRHISFELAILYWRFVDVVWLFLFVVVYWWAY